MKTMHMKMYVYVGNDQGWNVTKIIWDLRMVQE